MTASLNVGILGYGYASATFHAPLIASVPGLHLTAIASSRPDDVRADWPDATVHETPESLIAHPDIDLVVIATPNDTHAPLAAQALAAGKHVVVDKPFTLNAGEAQDLISLANQHQRLLSVFHNRRWDADFLSLQSVLKSGELGRITHFESHFDRYRPMVRQRWRESGGPGSGLWYDLGPHLLDQTLQLFGLPQSLWLDQASQRDASLADDWFHAVLGYGPMRVVLHASALTARVAPRFVVHGTAGSLVKWGLDTQEDALKAGLRPQQGTEGTHWGLDPQPLHLTVSDAQQTLTERQRHCQRGDYPQYYARVRDAVLHGAANPVPAQEALQVMTLIELGLQSAAQGQVMAVVA
jgi:scyllo-inositol 2-dehydrogenase (NADP+)